MRTRYDVGHPRLARRPRRSRRSSRRRPPLSNGPRRRRAAARRRVLRASPRRGACLAWPPGRVRHAGARPRRRGRASDRRRSMPRPAWSRRWPRPGRPACPSPWSLPPAKVGPRRPRRPWRCRPPVPRRDAQSRRRGSWLRGSQAAKAACLRARSACRRHRRAPPRDDSLGRRSRRWWRRAKVAPRRLARRPMARPRRVRRGPHRPKVRAARRGCSPRPGRRHGSRHQSRRRRRTPGGRAFRGEDVSFADDTFSTAWMPPRRSARYRVP